MKFKFINYFICIIIISEVISYKIISSVKKRLVIRKSYIDEINYKNYNSHGDKQKDEEKLNFDEVLKKIGSDLCNVSSYSYLQENTTTNNSMITQRKKNIIDENILHFFLHHKI